ncbi:MAG: hypothetical protein ABR608_04895 [Pseudonocardiaceae bacterium]
MQALGGRYEAELARLRDGESEPPRFRLNHLSHLNRCFGADSILEYFYPRAHHDSSTMTPAP